MKAFCSALLALVLAFGVADAAWAHTLETDYFLLDQAQLEIQAQFSSGEPFQQAPIQIYAPIDDTQPWIEGATDENGHFTFVPDPSIQGEWRVQIGALDHSDILKVPVTDRGVAAELISQAPAPSHRPHHPQWMVAGLMAVAATAGTRLLSAAAKELR